MTAVQWDVYPNPSARQRAELPYLVVMQSDRLNALTTRFVVPLARGVPAIAALPQRLCPLFAVSGEQLMLLPQEAGPIDARLLRHAVVNLREESQRLVDALDAVISGI